MNNDKHDNEKRYSDESEQICWIRTVPIFGIKVCSSILSFDIEYNLCGNDYIKM
jgi:hypothetical protein